MLCTRVAVCAKCYSNIMDGWDICCINDTVVAGITPRCLDRVLRDGGYVIVIFYLIFLIIFLRKKINHLKREGGGIDAASKDAPPSAEWIEFVQGMVHRRK